MRELIIIVAIAALVIGLIWFVVPRPSPGMVLVEKGVFSMGDSREEGNINELPVHEVSITYDFLIGKYEVTFDEYDEFCESTGRKKPRDIWEWGRGSRPVIDVSWWDAVAYCNWLSDMEGLPHAYDSDGNLVDKEGIPTSDPSQVKGYRLPTEAEWEYAARGGTKSKDYRYAGSNILGLVAWYNNNSGGKTREVGRRSSNELGINDMSGNVWEWCSDWYDSMYYSRSSSINPYNSDSAVYKVARGGCWSSSELTCRISARYPFRPDDSLSRVGFRICRTVYSD